MYTYGGGTIMHQIIIGGFGKNRQNTGTDHGVSESTNSRMRRILEGLKVLAKE